MALDGLNFESFNGGKPINYVYYNNGTLKFNSNELVGGKATPFTDENGNEKMKAVFKKNGQEVIFDSNSKGTVELKQKYQGRDIDFMLVNEALGLEIHGSNKPDEIILNNSDNCHVYTDGDTAADKVVLYNDSQHNGNVVHQGERDRTELFTEEQKANIKPLNLDYKKGFLRASGAKPTSVLGEGIVNENDY